jgi:selenide,water dikinase
MAERGAVRVAFDGDGFVAYPGAAQAAGRGVRTGGDSRNRDYVAGRFESSGDAVAEALCFDPQTSGGLLAAIDPAVAGSLDGFWRVGEVIAGEPGVVLR